MKVLTSRFGSVDIQADDILLFRNGLYGFEDLRHWVILADSDNPAVAWLQSMQQAETALPVVSPRRFIPGYQARVEPRELEPLQLSQPEQAYVLCVVGRNEDQLTVNLHAPILINLDRKLGCQVVTHDPQPLQHAIVDLPINLRRSA